MFSATDLLAGCGDGVVDDQVCLYRVFGQTPACQRTPSVSYISMEDILSCVLLNIILFSSCFCDRARVCFMSCNKAFSTTLSCGEIDRILWTENNKKWAQIWPHKCDCDQLNSGKELLPILSLKKFTNYKDIKSAKLGCASFYNSAAEFALL